MSKKNRLFPIISPPTSRNVSCVNQQSLESIQGQEKGNLQKLHRRIHCFKTKFQILKDFYQYSTLATSTIQKQNKFLDSIMIQLNSYANTLLHKLPPKMHSQASSPSLKNKSYRYVNIIKQNQKVIQANQIEYERLLQLQHRLSNNKLKPAINYYHNKMIAQIQELKCKNKILYRTNQAEAYKNLRKSRQRSIQEQIEQYDLLLENSMKKKYFLNQEIERVEMKKNKIKQILDQSEQQKLQLKYLEQQYNEIVKNQNLLRQKNQKQEKIGAIKKVIHLYQQSMINTFNRFETDVLTFQLRDKQISKQVQNLLERQLDQKKTILQLLNQMQQMKKNQKSFETKSSQKNVLKLHNFLDNLEGQGNFQLQLNI